MKPLFIKKNGTVSKVSGIIMNLIPSYTMAEYNALTHKPLLWVRTDEDYAQIPSTDVSYGSGSVKDALDDTKIFYKDVAIAGASISGYGGSVVTGVSAVQYEAIGFTEGASNSSEISVTVYRDSQSTFRIGVRTRNMASGTVPSYVSPIRVLFVKKSQVNSTPLS